MPCEQSIKKPAAADHLISPEKPSRTVHGTCTCSQTEYTHISAHASIKKSLHNIRCTLALQGQCIVFSEPLLSRRLKGKHCCPENYHHNVVVWLFPSQVSTGELLLELMIRREVVEDKDRGRATPRNLSAFILGTICSHIFPGESSAEGISINTEPPVFPRRFGGNYVHEMVILPRWKDFLYLAICN